MQATDRRKRSSLTGVPPGMQTSQSTGRLTRSAGEEISFTIFIDVEQTNTKNQRTCSSLWNTMRYCWPFTQFRSSVLVFSQRSRFDPGSAGGNRSCDSDLRCRAFIAQHDQSTRLSHRSCTYSGSRTPPWITGRSSSQPRTAANSSRPRETTPSGHRTRFRQRAAGRLPDHQSVPRDSAETECWGSDSCSVRWLSWMPDLLHHRIHSRYQSVARSHETGSLRFTAAIRTPLPARHNPASRVSASPN